MFSVVVHLVELVSNHMLRWIGLKLVTMWIAQKCISVNARIHIQSGLKLVRNCSVNRPLYSKVWWGTLHSINSTYELPSFLYLCTVAVKNFFTYRNVITVRITLIYAEFLRYSTVADCANIYRAMRGKSSCFVAQFANAQWLEQSNNCCSHS